MSEWLNILPPEASKIVLTLFLSFLLGIEREEHKDLTKYSFGGVRTFPLIGIVGLIISTLGNNQVLPCLIGFAVISGFMFLSYKHKLSITQHAGLTTEMSGLLVYLVGVLVAHEQYWVSCTLVVVGLLLLELKEWLESLAKKIPAGEIITFTKFLLITLVILPILPNQDFTVFKINPFKTWLIVAAVTGISYGSYVLRHTLADKSGIMPSAVFGGAYSSTFTTVALAKSSSHDARPHLYSGGILVASGVMYLRLIVLLMLFSPTLLRPLGGYFLALAVAALLFGYFWARKVDHSPSSQNQKHVKNPLELTAALLFMVLYVSILVVAQLTMEHFGVAGIYGLAAFMGVTDVDPFILSLTQMVHSSTTLTTAAAGIVIATSSNNLVKAVYAHVFGERQTGRQGSLFLVVLAVLGLAPLIWIWRA